MSNYYKSRHLLKLLGRTPKTSQLFVCNGTQPLHAFCHVLVWGPPERMNSNCYFQKFGGGIVRVLLYIYFFFQYHYFFVIIFFVCELWLLYSF